MHFFFDVCTRKTFETQTSHLDLTKQSIMNKSSSCLSQKCTFLFPSKVGAKRAGLHPGFASHGALFLGQEQEHLCGGFDHYDSLSGDLAEFQVKVISALL